MANLTCSGPGPHIPANGILGTTSQPGVDVRCSSASCTKAVDPRVTNKTTLTDKVTAAIAANVTFLAIASPTAAQVATQAKAQAKQWNALAKIVLDLLDDTTGT